MKHIHVTCGSKISFLQRILRANVPCDTPKGRCVVYTCSLFLIITWSLFIWGARWLLALGFSIGVFRSYPSPKLVDK